MNTEIRIANNQDIPALCEIWKNCFSDSEEYIKYFYSDNFNRIKTYILTVDEKPVSMINMLPALFENKGASQGARFLYAVGTLKAHRGKGYMGKLIDFAKNQAEENGFALFLKPSNPALTDYYKAFGFDINSYFRLVSITPGEKFLLSVCETSPAEYNRLRNAAFDDIPYVKWEEEHIRWCIEENKYFSGKTIKFEFDGKEHFLLGYPEDKTLIINETDLSLSQLEQLSGALCNIFKTEMIKAYMPDYSCGEGERIISSVAYNAAVDKTYINLILI
ncbi:MAG: GNAT family N-acetyltransferase [Eubacterium sp.]|nr:GNAT family N-acetyltransferase [Eubacterium sp.]